MAYFSVQNKSKTIDNQAYYPEKYSNKSMASKPKPPTHPLIVLSATVFAGLLVVVLLISGIGYGIYKYYLNSDRIALGVKVLNLDIGGMSATDAAILLHKTWNLENKISVSDEINEFFISPETIGLSVDPLVTARNAHKIGRSKEFLSNLSQLFSSYSKGIIILPVVVYDPDAARSGIETLIPKMSQEPENATLKINGTEIVEVPGELGFTINIEDTVNAIEAKPFETMINGSAKIYLKPVSPPVNDVSEAKNQFKKLIESSVAIEAYDPIIDKKIEWHPSPEEISRWIVIEQGENGPVVTLDEIQAEEYIQKINDEISPERYLNGSEISSQLIQAVKKNAVVQAEIKYLPTTYQVKKGDTLLKIGWNLKMPFWKIIEANPGLDPDNVIAGTELTIPAKDELLPLPVIPNKRIKISISKQKMWVYENGELIRNPLISTGIDKSPTQPGVFQVQTHKKNAYASVWDLYMPNFLGVYEAWPGFMNGIHGLPTLSNGTRLWENILGRPASYGCIILDLDTSKWLYNWAEDGVVVVIEE
jgi:LysM repeat protein